MQSKAARGAVCMVAGAAAGLWPGLVWAAEIADEVMHVAGWVAAALALTVALTVLYFVERTSRRKAEAALARETAENAQLSTLLSATTARFWCIGADGRQHGSDGLGRWLGVPGTMTDRKSVV